MKRAYSLEFRICDGVSEYSEYIERDDLQSCCKGLFADDLSQPKVSYFDAKLLIYEQDVLRLDVTMNNITFMLFPISPLRFRRWFGRHTKYLIP